MGIALDICELTDDGVKGAHAAAAILVKALVAALKHRLGVQPDVLIGMRGSRRGCRLRPGVHQRQRGTGQRDTGQHLA